MGYVDTDRALSGEEIAEIRQRANIAAKQYASMAEAAGKAGVAYSTFHAFLKGSYTGNNEKVALDVQRWLNSREDARAMASQLVTSPGFQETRNATKVTNLLTMAKVIGEMGVLTGPPGVGKTVAALEFAKTNSAVFMATMDETTSSVTAAVREVCTVMGVKTRGLSPVREIASRLKELEKPLLIIDESQHLKVEAVNQLRAIHDRTGCGLVLMGNEEIYGRIGGPKGAYAQLHSRVGLFVNLKTFNDADAATLARAWGFSEEADIAYLRSLSRKPGHLRTLDKVLSMAALVANGREETLSISHVKEAWQQREASVSDAPGA